MARIRAIIAIGLAAAPSPLKGLTRRERQILRALGDGLSDLQIAAVLLLYECAVREHVRHILRKLRMSRTEAAAYARRAFDADNNDSAGFSVL
jgi:DNA-binding NarL/FixJ family response regulator